MNFCSSLVHDINFKPTAVQPCCDVHGVEVPRFPFIGGRLDMAAYAAHIEKSFQRLQASEGKLCRNCPELKEITGNNAGNIRILFLTIGINMHRHLCNCKCVYGSPLGEDDRRHILPKFARGKAKGYRASALPDCRRWQSNRKPVRWIGSNWKAEWVVHEVWITRSYFP